MRLSPPARAVSLLLFAATLSGTIGCCTRSEGPPPPTLVRMVRDKALASFDVFLPPADTATREALQDLQARSGELTTWSALLEAWQDHAPLDGAFDPDKKIRQRLEGQTPFQEEEVPDAVFLEGFFAAVATWLERNR